MHSTARPHCHLSTVSSDISDTTARNNISHQLAHERTYGQVDGAPNDRRTESQVCLVNLVHFG